MKRMQDGSEIVHAVDERLRSVVEVEDGGESVGSCESHGCGLFAIHTDVHEANGLHSEGEVGWLLKRKNAL